MTKRRTVFLGVGVVVVAALAAVAWVVWSEPPPPPPSTADEVYEAVVGTDPAELPDAEREAWVEKVGSGFQRLPPHEFEKLIEKTMRDEAWRERMRSLEPEQRARLRDLQSQEQQLQRMTAMVEMLKKLPPETRQQMFQMGRRRMAGRRGKHPEITKDRIIERLAATTPTQRAKFAQAMRELRNMRDEARRRD